MSKKIHVNGTILAFIAIALFSTYSIFGKFLLVAVDPFVIIIFNQLIAVVILTLFIDLMHKMRKIKKISKQSLKIIGLISIFSAVLGPLFFLYGLNLTSATNAILINKSEAVLTSFLAVLFLKDKVTIHQIFGTLIMFFGVVIIATENFAAGLSFNIGDVLIVAACLSYAIGTVLFKKYMHKIPAEIIVTLRNLFGASILFIVSFFIGDLSTITALWDMKMFLLILGLALCTTVFGQMFFYKALEMTTATNVSLAGLSSPLIAICYAMIFLGETMGRPQITGGICIIIGLIVLELHFKSVHSEKQHKRHLKLRHMHTS